MIDLFVTRKEPKLWVAVGEHFCHNCEVNIQEGIFSVLWKKGETPQILLFCFHCAEKRKNYGHYETKNTQTVFGKVRIFLEKPKEVRIWVPYPPGYKNGYLSVYDAAYANNDKKISADTSHYHIYDRTIYADRESIVGSQIGLSPQKVIEKFDFSVQDVDTYLLELKKAKVEDKLLGGGTS